LQLLSTPQLRAVIAHEFGHFHGGDTLLGNWVYRTREAIIRTVQSLSGGWLQAPFRWYAQLFLKLTQAVSRQQEFAADRLAAEVGGSNHVAGSLRVVHAAGPLFDKYWQEEVVPVLQAGYRPALADGFSRFMRAPHITEIAARLLAHESEEAESDPYDSHPSLSERLAAIATVPTQPDEPTPAYRLVPDLAALETSLLAYLFGDQQVENLSALDWDQVAQVVYTPLWQQSAEPFRPLLSAVTAEALPRVLETPGSLLAELRQQVGRPLNEDEQHYALARATGTVLASALLERGWTAQVAPGEAIRFERDGKSFDPFAVSFHLMRGDVTPEGWQTTCQELGIHGMTLGGVAQNN
jgi:heat shock protein HtpX